MDTCDRIFDLLRARGLEQKEFAHAIDVHPQLVTDWKKGKSKSYSKWPRLAQIASTLGTTTDYLLYGKETGFTQRPDFLIKFESLDPDDKQEVIAIIEMKAARKKKS